MAVDPEDCLYPRWRLKAEVLWPGLSLAKVKTALAELIAQGVVASAGLAVGVQDIATKWYTAYLAYDGRYQQLVGLPSSVDVRDEGSSSYSATQIALMAELRDQALAEFEGFTAGTGDSIIPAQLYSRTTRATFEF